MSNRPNPRRDEERRTENGPRWESKNPGAGCNSTHVARGRAKWKRRRARMMRRTGTYLVNGPFKGKKPKQLDEYQETPFIEGGDD